MKTPRPYQIEDRDRASRQNLLIANACGTGKTLIAIETAKIVQSQINKPVLIVAPSSTVKLQWFNALVDQGICADRIFWLDSSTKITGTWFAASETIILTHYEAVRKHLTTLQNNYYSVIVADEAHRIKNRKALRTIAVKSLKAYRKIALTGTPYDRNPSDIWSILNWLDPQFYTSYWRFFESHTNYEEKVVGGTMQLVNGKYIRVGGNTIKEVSPNQPKNAERFSRVLRTSMIQRSKSDVRSDMPARNDIFIDLEMGTAQARAYAKIRDARDPIVQLADGLETTVPIVLTRILREIQITTDPSLLGLVGSPSVKLEWLTEWLEDNPNESVIIFTRFRETAIKLHKQLGDAYTLIIGGQRGDVDASVTRIIGTIAAMGEGLNLPHIDNEIFLDREWSSILMEQAFDRIHRINITNAKNIYFLRCVNTVDYLLEQANNAKWTTKELVASYLKGRNNSEYNSTTNTIKTTS